MCLQLITPANTPATPPNFPDALTMFSKMSTSDATKMATSPLAPSAISPRNQQNSSLNSRNSFSPGMMSPPPAPPPLMDRSQPQMQGFMQSTNQPWRGQFNHPNVSPGGFGSPNRDQTPQQVLLKWDTPFSFKNKLTSWVSFSAADPAVDRRGS